MKFPIHSLEEEWNIHAEFILEAINRSQDITKRGVRGIIAELAFSTYIIDPIRHIWDEEVLFGDLPYDAKLTNGKNSILIQTKNQRLVKGEPLRPTKTAIKNNPELADWYIAETQKTRSGVKRKKNNSGELDSAEVEEVKTRPYRFGEFDILSVCMQPSTGNWKDFMFTPSRTLLPKNDDGSIIATFQPVPAKKIYNWTHDILECIEWVLNPDSMPEPFVPTNKTSRKS